MDTWIGFLFLFTISPCIALECPSCKHIGFEYINMPANFESKLAGMMSSLDSLKNEPCSNNTAPTETCAVSSGVDTVIDTCISFTFTMTCMGFTASNLPDTEMRITVVTRECSTSPVGTEDSCREIDTVLDAEGQAEIIKSLESMNDLFESVEYDGDICTSSTDYFTTIARVTVTDGASNTTAGARKINTEPTSGSSTIMFMPITVLVIAMYLV
ncbi:uncharacterized protein LOC128242454 [Mya arenaria]|uniref:uncharacterized protein LOC128242454 n=1 Tax=Mya arenaria TaxID=6604 RepID=UPI0022E92825|nr:uncharacterized protein LOC128242454 [Mya arenaria]